MARAAHYETTDGRCAIDLAWMRRQKRIGGTVTWSVGGLRYGSVEWSLGSENVVLQYSGHRERVPLTWTPLHFGGEREWFQCLSCRGRCRVLYLGRAGYRCRKCCGLRYSSQRQPAWMRAIEIANRLQRRLGGETGLGEGLPRRPKGMHRVTYARLTDRYWRLSDDGMGGLLKVVGRHQSAMRRSS